MSAAPPPLVLLQWLGFDRSSSGISKQQIELFAIEIPDSDTEKDSPPPPPLLKQKLNPHVVMDLPQSIFIAALGSSVYCFGNVKAFDVSCPPAAAASFFRRYRLVI
ncbi:uncharacterized protein LOC136066535 [Quercus suber]|uniref:uncharacterized protein LOC136066535 n=1 Tax=Quercus suber TaxID=58331 RepID=UPI0032DFC468